MGKIDLFKQTAGLIIGVAWHRPYKRLAFGRLRSERNLFFFDCVQVGAKPRRPPLNFNRKCFSCEFEMVELKEEGLQSFLFCFFLFLAASAVFLQSSGVVVCRSGYE